MNLFAVLKQVRLKHILKGILFGIRRPLFLVPTVKATKDCIRISTENYGKLHHKNGPANAFRHAFWNYLIAKRCFRWSKDEETVVNWSKKVTDWHEDAFLNDELAKEMDLHNNAVGRFLFRKNPASSEQEAIEILKKMTLNSTKIDLKTDLSKLKNQLVHILEA